MGVDRTSDLMFDIVNWRNLVFEGGDDVWSNIQNNMIQFIIDNGGDTELYGPPKIIDRPKYLQVESYLRGEINFTELKSLLGC